VWAPGAGGASGATGYLFDEAAGFYLRGSQDRKVGLDTSIVEEPENQAKEPKRDMRLCTDMKEVMNGD
jgi:hypothetical protein